jgi:hypothetical protein
VAATRGRPGPRRRQLRLKVVQRRRHSPAMRAWLDGEARWCNTGCLATRDNNQGGIGRHAGLAATTPALGQECNGPHRRAVEVDREGGDLATASSAWKSVWLVTKWQRGWLTSSERDGSKQREDREATTSERMLWRLSDRGVGSKGFYTLTDGVRAVPP